MERLQSRLAPILEKTDDSAIAIPLAPGISVHCAIPELDGTIELGIRHHDEFGERKLIAPNDGPKHFKLDVGPIEIDLSMGADNRHGVVVAEGRVLMPETDEHPAKGLIDVGGEIFHYAPAHGSVGGEEEAHPPIFRDPEFGQTKMSSKNVTRIFVEDRYRRLANVGQVVKRTLWDDYPDWVFNTVACVGAFDAEGRGSYSDPTSPWFNVFLGYYQIDAPKDDGWDRPFGYESADGAASQVRVDEIIRLGKSDWNYFSNWMYGVPAGMAEQHNEVDVRLVRAEQTDAGAIGEGSWHRLRIDGPRFVSAYEADADGAEKLVRNSVLSGMWRKAFGIPNPRPEFPSSFIPTTLEADMYIAYWEDDEAFHTTIFGGTAPSGANPAFLERQMAAAKHVIAMNYRTLGFSQT